MKNKHGEQQSLLGDPATAKAETKRMQVETEKLQSQLAAVKAKSEQTKAAASKKKAASAKAKEMGAHHEAGPSKVKEVEKTADLPIQETRNKAKKETEAKAMAADTEQ